ncbi:MAG: V-type ATPase subunit [bacterium]
MKNTYHYSLGRIRSLEAHLLTDQQISRMSKAADFESAFSVLSETPYAEILPRLKNPFDFEELYQLEMIALEELLLKLSFNNPIIKALFAKKDYQASEKHPFKVDREYFLTLKKACATSQSPLIKNFIKHKIDSVNLKSLLRCQSINRLKLALIAGGLLDKDILSSLFGKTAQDMIAKLSYSPYFPEIKKGFEVFEQNNSPHLLEKLMDNFMIQKFKKAKYLSLGLEPLVGFYLAKQIELKTIRFVLICKKNSVANKEIGERVRVSYA